MDHLDELEARSVYILREACHSFSNLCMPWSTGKDTNVLIWPFDSRASNIADIIQELLVTKTRERAQDHHERNAMQKLRARGFM